MIAFRDELFDGQLLRTLGHSVYGAAEPGVCFAAAAQIRSLDRDRWYAAWMRAGDAAMARRAFLCASNYYRAAYVFHLEAPLPAAARRAYALHREAFVAAAAELARPVVSFAIPFEGGALPAYWCPAGGATIEGERRPLVISVGGYDSTAEESYLWNGAAATARGYHAVVFDGPGQGAMLVERGQTFRPDWSSVISAVIDAAVARPDVDPARVVVIAESFGGYLAPRAAARDARIAACVLDPPQLGLFRAVRKRLPGPRALVARLPEGPRWLVALLRPLIARRARRLTAGWALRRGMLAHGVATPWEYLVDMARYEQADIVPDIRCPTLVCEAEADDLASDAGEFFDALTCPKARARFTAAEGAAEHCSSGNRALYHARVFDWLAATLA